MAPKAKKVEPKAEVKKTEEATKRKAEESAEGEAPTKESKVEEKKEKEEDAPTDKKPTIKETIGFNANDLTLNVVPTLNDKLLTTVNDGGLQYYIAGARANVGVKAGRYMFETRIVEALNPMDYEGQKRPPMPKQMMRIGFSTAGSPLVLGTSDDSVFFDAEGKFYAGKATKACSQRFNKDQVIAVVLNLDQGSPNKNTLSLFRDGVRVSEPQAIPEGLHGKVLYPHLSFRNVTVETLWGKEPEKDLPFVCKTVQGATKDDVVVSQQKKTGENKVVFPVGVPNQGLFAWAESFLAKNPDYVELSERKLTEWAEASGMWRKGGGSLDKPDFWFGLPMMEDRSVQRIIANVAPMVPRNYVVLEAQSNLIADDRKRALGRFSASCFKKIAHVAMGEPDAAFKKKQLDELLAEKQAKNDKAWQSKKTEIERKKNLKELREKQAAEKKKRQEEAAARLAEAKAKKEAEAKAKAEAKKAAEGDKKENDEEKKEEKKEEEVKEEEKKEDIKEEVKEEKKEEAKEEEKKDEEMKDAKKEEEEKEEELPAEPEKAELTEEEKNQWFRTTNPPEMLNKHIDRNFAKFSVPEKAEGFDEVLFAWQSEGKAKEHFRAWLLEKKRTSRIEDLQPSQWYQDKLKAMQATLKEYMALAEKKTEAKEDEGEKDVKSVEDVKDVGNGVPLFKQFTSDDWALVQLRFELFLLAAGFKHDVDDADRAGIPEQHAGFYFSRYLGKSPTPSHFGVANLKDQLALAKDTVKWTEDSLLITDLEEDTSIDHFVKLAEEGRRARQLRIDAGDETARLKFTKEAMTAADPSSRPQGKNRGPYQGGKGGKGGGKSGGKGGGKGYGRW